MKFFAAALLFLAFISFTESVEDNGPNLGGREIDDEEVDDPADLFEFRQADLSKIFTLGNATFGGTGCPAGTVRTVASPEDIPGEEGVSAVSILFDQYFAETDAKRSRDYKSCVLAIPMKVKPGIQVGIFQASKTNTEFLCTRSMMLFSNLLAPNLTDRLPWKHLCPSRPWIHVAV